MSEVQEILIALAVALHANQIGEEGCDSLAKALDGVPEQYHMSALKALIGMEQTKDDF